MSCHMIVPMRDQCIHHQTGTPTEIVTPWMFEHALPHTLAFQMSHTLVREALL